MAYTGAIFSKAWGKVNGRATSRQRLAHQVGGAWAEISDRSSRPPKDALEILSFAGPPSSNTASRTADTVIPRSQMGRPATVCPRMAICLARHQASTVAGI